MQFNKLLALEIKSFKIMYILIKNLKLFFINNFFRILWFSWILFIVFQIYMGPTNNKNLLLGYIRNNEFSGIIIKREKAKRGGTFTFIETKNGIFKNDDSSYEFVSNSEIGDSVYKEKGINCCLIASKNKRVKVPYIISELISEYNDINCGNKKRYEKLPEQAMPEVEIQVKK